eukprot:14276708-Alexandrium_andersonii.AAC.1
MGPPGLHDASVEEPAAYGGAELVAAEPAGPSPDQQLDAMVARNQIEIAFKQEGANTVQAVLGEFRVVAQA